MGSLSADLGIPELGGKIIACRDSMLWWWNEYWYIQFVVDGPDLRFSSAVLTLSEREVQSVIPVLQRSLERMHTLRQRYEVDSYRETLAQSQNAGINIRIDSGVARLDVWTDTRTQRYWRTFSEEAVRYSIQRLMEAKELGANMISQLR
jgi:hypothetical protein